MRRGRRNRTPESYIGQRKFSKATPVELSKKTIALSVNFHKFGSRKKVSTSKVRVDADKKWIGVSKRILEAKELKDISALDREAREYLEAKSLPSLFAAGIYLVPNGFVQEVNDRLKEFAKGRTSLVKKFGAVYETCIKQAKKNLRELFDGGDYPGVEKVKDAFFLRWEWVSFNTPGSLAHISHEIHEEEKAKAAARWQEATDTVQQMIRQDFSEMISYMAERLTPDAKGKKKKFKDASITKISEFLKEFEIMNVTNDAELDGLVEQVRKMMAGTTPQLLRNQKDSRETIRQGFEKVKSQIDGMIEDKPRRTVSFED